MYVARHYDTITNLFRLTNSDTIDVCKLDDVVIATIKVLLLITKTRGAQKSLTLYRVRHKWLTQVCHFTQDTFVLFKLITKVEIVWINHTLLPSYSKPK